MTPNADGHGDSTVRADRPVVGRVLSLCDRTGVMVEPWLAAGFDATIVDIQHETGVIDWPTPGGGMLSKVGADVRDIGWIHQWLGKDLTDYDIVFAFPPCTHLAKSGARWWKDKGLTALIEALTVVEACRAACEASGAPYMIENPSGALSTHWRKPDHAFDPLDFGAYVLDGEDYTKLTNLWVGGGFVMPKRRPLPKSDTPNPIHWAPPGPGRADARSITPRGFAQAVFEANAEQVRARRVAA